ncbi:MAG: ASKHA domain-containing protein [Clostridiales bacterium]|jgi:uncharacterized 2Fe-2S/4Fe-4S cluster protein (DUF4445 family)|nr:ASKHA domain-containing protein [Clostridiales bacterium]
MPVIRIENTAYAALAGETVLAALTRHGVVLSAPCGGRGVCGKCRVRLISGQVSGAQPNANGFVRACGAIPQGDVVIELPRDSGTSGGETAEINVTGRIAGAAGVALDLGTTTVSAALVDLATGEVAEVVSRLNAQRAFGADVMSRIAAAQGGSLAALYAAINRQTAEILGGFIQKYGLKSVETLVVAGNTTMLHLFLNVDPTPIGHAPFTPVFLGREELAGAELDLPVARVTVLPSAGAYIGADITAGLAFLQPSLSEPALLIDLGTNGELAVCRRGEILCCSTAAGPAFEGAEISCGTGGVTGAVNRVDYDGAAVGYRTIGGARAVGICGCGLVDAVAVMLQSGAIDETGAFAGAARRFPIADGVSITERDVRQFQLAKSAIRAGLEVLTRRAGLALADFKRIYVAGGLGFFVRPGSAFRTGLLPEEFAGKIAACGNTSLKGAIAALTEDAFTARCEKIAIGCRVIDLTSDASFSEAFIENMTFPA